MGLISVRLGASTAAGRPLAARRSRAQFGGAKLSAAKGGALAVALVLALRGVLILSGGEDALVGAMPDDAFYYFVLAKNFAASGHWSFDGTAPATGFHLLWAYALAGLYRLWSGIGLTGLYGVSLLTGIGCFAATARLMIKALVPRYGEGAAPAVLLVLLGGAVTRLPGMGMEGPLVILAAAGAAWLQLSGGRGAGRLGLAALTGFAGMMARSDFGLLPACFCAIAALRLVLCPAERREAGRQLLTSLALLLGAIAGLAAVAAHSALISGSLIQNSARMKAYWSSLEGLAPLKALTQAANIFCYNALLPLPLLGAFVIAGLGALGLRAVRKSGRDWTPPAIGLAASLFYVALYSHNSQSLQPWYAASFAIPMMLLLAPGIAWLSGPALTGRRRAVFRGALGLLMLGDVLGSLVPLWSYQRGLRDAGLYLHAHPQIAPVGAFNGGLISYFSGRSIVNLDGLVNDDIYPYATQGRLLRYISRRGIGYVLDYAVMFENRAVARRGGYGDGRLAACLHPALDLSGGSPALQWAGSPLTLYRVEPDCMLNAILSASR